MDNNNQVEVLELTIKEAEAYVKLRNDLIALSKNRSFQNVISNGYFKDYAASLVGSLSEPAIATNEAKRQEVLRDVQGIATLHSFFRKVSIEGAMAERSIEDAKEQLEQLATEQ